MRDHYVNLACLGPQQLSLARVLTQVLDHTPSAMTMVLFIEIIDRVLNFNQISVIAPTEQVRIPGRAEEPHAINRYSFADEIVKIFDVFCSPVPDGINIPTRLPTVVFVVTRHINDRRKSNLLLNEGQCLAVRTDIASQHEHIAIGYGPEFQAAWLAVLSDIQVQVRRNLNLHRSRSKDQSFDLLAEQKESEDLTLGRSIFFSILAQTILP